MSKQEKKCSECEHRLDAKCGKGYDIMENVKDGACTQFEAEGTKRFRDNKNCRPETNCLN